MPYHAGIEITHTDTMTLASSLLLVPGTMCDERLWQRLLPVLPANFSATCLPLHTAPSRAAMMAMLDQACQPQHHLIGFSMGGYLALEYALTHPNKLRSLTLIASSAGSLGTEEREMRNNMLKWLQHHDYLGMSRRRLASLVHPSKLDDPAVGGLIRQMDRELGKATLVTQLRETSERHDLYSRLGQLRCPLLLIGGADDLLVTPDKLMAMQQQLPSAQLHVLPASAHMIPLEQPDTLAALLAQFLANFT